jgi:enoyl-CoA hydratase/carnithine racemase
VYVNDTWHGFLTNYWLVADVYRANFLEDWAQLSRVRKPIIAAVSGYAVSDQWDIPNR